MNKLLPILSILVLVSLACSLPASWIKRTPTPAGSNPTQTPQVIQLARQSLADELRLPVDKIAIASVERVTWEDTCLGLPSPNETCQPAQVDGYRIVFKTSSQEYTYHTDTLSSYRRVPQEEFSVIALQSRQLLAGLLGFDPESIQIISEQQVKFSDSCLGIHIPEVTCSQIPTPGTIVALQAGDNTFVFHSGLNPISPMLAEVAGISTSSTSLIWSRQGGRQNACDDIRLYLSGWAVQYYCLGVSGSEPGVFTLTPTQQRQLLGWMLNYRPFEFRASSLDGTSVLLTFYGIGKTDPTYDEQELVSEFAAGLLKTPATPMPTLP